MHEATVTIVKKYPPDAGKKMWKLVADTGEKFLAFPTEANAFQEGVRCTFNYTSSDFQGRTFHTVKGAPRMVPGALIKVSSPGDVIVPTLKPHGADPRQIFVCAIVKEWVPKIPIGETTTLISAIQSAIDAYDQTFGGKPAPEFNDSLNIDGS